MPVYIPSHAIYLCSLNRAFCNISELLHEKAENFQHHIDSEDDEDNKNGYYDDLRSQESTSAPPNVKSTAVSQWQ